MRILNQIQMNKVDSKTRKLRWLAVLPVSFISLLLALFPVHWIAVFLFGDHAMFELSEENLAYVERILTSFFTSWAFVVGGVWCAPERKMETAIALVVIFFVLWLSCLAYVALLPGVDLKLLEPTRLMSCLLAFYIALRSIRKRTIMNQDATLNSETILE